MRLVALLLTATALSACGESGPVNPATEPAQPIEVADPAVPIDDGTIPMTPGRAPRSFVGRWAADVAWCAASQGDGRPIEITATRFEGYENSCAIGSIDEVRDGYVATLACEAEGTSNEERVKMSVADEVLTLTYLDRSGEPVELRKCTTLADTVP